MVLSKNDMQNKLEKMARSAETFQFGLSPEGFLLVSRGKVVEVCDFKLFHGGKYYRRNGFKFSTNMQVEKNGMVLCSLGNGKFVAGCAENQFEYASAKKPLSTEFCMVLQMRFAGRIVLLIADGDFSNEACMVTLTDNHNNELFATAIVRKLVGLRDDHAAQMLYAEEVDENGEEA